MVAGVEMPHLQGLVDGEDGDYSSISTFYTKLNLADVSDCAIYMTPIMPQICDVAVFRPVDKKAAKRVREAIDSRLVDLRNGAYLPMQEDILERHQVIEKNGYLIFVAADAVDAVLDNFYAAIK